ncbi:TRM11 family SAM-dependent methyltransferase [Crossiella cryophila]|uniref:SAM-dependent methyltransferase n=1 Tax=Crossiella cryophila TaxID=43355 RepID=A0A7W7CE52_9PSEU|nr:DNA methyltransferase [Crossiella cryophila]MBB4679484.1 SAM-dependent methyltransferase [Crossiella cryophila]
MTAERSKSAATAVWFTGERSLTDQLRRGGYAPATQADHDQVPPTIAAHAITTRTQPGDLILDPDCGAGTVLTEALYTGRRAIGLTVDPRWRRVARMNLTAAHRNGARRPGTVLTGTPGLLRDAEATGLAGQVDLVLTSLRGHRLSTSLDHAGARSEWTARCRRLADTLSDCHPLLRPGGHAVVVIQPTRCGDVLLDLPTQVLEAGRAAGLIPIQRGIAMTARVRGHEVFARVGFAARRAAEQARAAGTPIALTAHCNVVIFRARILPANLLADGVATDLPPATASSRPDGIANPGPSARWAA